MPLFDRFSICTKIGLAVSLFPALGMPFWLIIDYTLSPRPGKTLEEMLLDLALFSTAMLFWAPFQLWPFTVYGRISMRLLNKLQHQKALIIGMWSGLIAMSIAVPAYWVIPILLGAGQGYIAVWLFAPVAMPVFLFGLSLPVLFAFYFYIRFTRARESMECGE